MAKNEVKVFVKEIATGKVTLYATQRSACVALGLNVRSQLRNGQIVGHKFKIGRCAITKRVISPAKKSNGVSEENIEKALKYIVKKYGSKASLKLAKAMTEFNY